MIILSELRDEEALGEDRVQIRENERLMKRVNRLCEGIEDFDRGILSRDELLEIARDG